MKPQTRNLLLAGAAVAVVLLVIMNTGERSPADVEAAAGDPSIGQGNLTVFLFEDYQCGHCQEYALGPNYQHLLDTWVQSGHVRVVFKHVAFVGPFSEPAAIASRCVAAHGGSWDNWDHDVYALQAAGGVPTGPTLAELADAHETDMDAYQACMEGPGHASAIASNWDAFQDAGASGTPAIVIGGDVLNPNDIEAVDAAIRATQ